MFAKSEYIKQSLEHSESVRKLLRSMSTVLNHIANKQGAWNLFSD